MDANQIISAQVMLRAASGRSLRGAEITAATLSEYLPDPAVAEQIRSDFQERGFDVGSLVGNSFSITASAATFEKVFHTTLRSGTGGDIRTEQSAGHELPLSALKKQIAEHLEAVTFSPPPDFGPTDY